MNKKRSKTLFRLLILVLVIFCVYCTFKAFTTGKQVIEITTNSKYYKSDNLEAIIEVKNRKNDESLKSNLKIELLDSDEKKVKNFKESYAKNENEEASISIPFPENVESGNYTLKVTAKSGLKKDIKEVDISLVDGYKSKAIISVDKGIYKPGDTVNFRALVTSKKTSQPVKQKVNIEIYDGNDNRVYVNDAETSEFGIVSGTFVLADEVNSGTYRISVTTNDEETSKMFNVNPYAVPKYEANITSDKESYTVGETANLTVNAKYFFGEPVKNAKITGTINDKKIEGITDENGNYTVPYEINKKGKIDVNIEVVDSSNYYVETSKTVYASTDKFEVEILPENGNIIKGIDNEVYVLTKTVDGKPVKAHATVTLYNIKKQVITNDEGVGKVLFTSNELESLNIASYLIDVKATDEQQNSVDTSVSVYIENHTGMVIKTDKIKYNQGDDINILLNSATDVNDEKIFIYKDDELLKMISTDSNVETVNLNNINGLVDIYVTGGQTSSKIDDWGFVPITSISSRENYFKKTIFIKPSKTLNIGIETDKEEYKPGESLNVKFKTTDESEKSVDSALLVSILDEAVLNLAENDLSIDNIKVALSDITLTDGVTASDLYAEIIDEKSEALLSSVLLKQSSTDPNIVRDTLKSYEDSNYKELAVMSVIVILAIVAVKASIKSKKVSGILVHLVNCVAIFLIIINGAYDFLYYDVDLSEELVIISSIVFTIISYVLILYKKKEVIFKLIVELAILPGIFLAVISFLAGITGNDILYVLVLTPLLLYVIFEVKSRKKGLKDVEKKLKLISEILLKSAIVYIATGLVASIFNIENILIIAIILIAIDKLYEYIYGKNKDKKTENGTITINITGMEGIGVVAGIALILLALYGLYSIMNNFSASVYDSSAQDSSYNRSNITNFDTMSPSSTINSSIEKSEALKATEVIKDLFSDRKETSEVIEEEKSDENQTQENTKTEENVRNVFLESLAFIPELVTNNGIAQTDIPISDNITTWNIQTVGNTQDGNIGYSNKTIKVFKEFFIDFSLPTNSVVTDKTSIPVTVYNYKDTDLTVSLNVVQNDWSTIGEYEKSVIVPKGQTKLVYVPIEITKDGDGKLRVEATENGVQDIVERTMKITPNGAKKSNVISSGIIDNKYTQDMFITQEEAIPNTRNVTVKIYPTFMSQVVEGMENIFEMPTGCFEQTSSSLYPDILALKYLNTTGNANEKIKNMALEYISKGYQRLLTYEVKGKKGGYSLYGNSPAETVLTAFGLMEINDLKSVYDVEDKIPENMIEFLYGNQKNNGSFKYNSTYIGTPAKSDDLAMNAYIIWALTESDPEDERLEKSIEYLEKNLDEVDDNYTLALIANIFVNTDNKEKDKVINRLMNNIQKVDDMAYVSSKIRDYWGSCNKYQNLQATALTSIALTKDGSNVKTNNALIKYIISQKDPYGNWRTTQATILSLKALNEYTKKDNSSKQKISISLNDEVKDIDIGDNPLDSYFVTFDNVLDENKITIDMKNGNIYYEIIEEYYVDYNKLTDNPQLEVSQELASSGKVNDEIIQTIKLDNNSNEIIRNGLVEISIPQGFSVIEDSLLELKYNGLIEKYEYNYGKINIYLRDWVDDSPKELKVKYRANYPESVTGGLVRVYDYYNPETEGVAKPQKIDITN